MNIFRNHFFLRLLFYFISFIVFFSSPLRINSVEIEWSEVSKTNKELLSIAPKSIKYNSRGFLTVIAKHSEIDSESQTLNNDTFLMAIDCENRLFSKFPVSTDLKQVKNWESPIDNKLIKKTIINTCSY